MKRNISVTFHVDVYDSKPWFQIPSEIAKLLDLTSREMFALTISAPNGNLLYHGFANMGSGREIYRSYVSKFLKKGEEIRVTVSRAPKDSLPRPSQKK